MPASGEIIQVTHRYLNAGQLCENVLNFRERSPGKTNAQIDNDINLFINQIAQIQASDTTYLKPMWKRMTPVAFDESFTTLTGATQGAIGGGSTNSTIALVITERTGVAGGRHRGRMYIGGIPAAWVNPNTLFGAGVAAANTFVADYLSVFDDAAGTSLHLACGIYSKITGGTMPYTLAGWQPCTSLVVQALFGTQRRRRIGVGS